jgi:cytochrome subunit of sulfide dehydrogenase
MLRVAGVTGEPIRTSAMMSLDLRVLACAMLACAGSTLAAAEMDARALAAGCLACHQPVANTPLPVLFGQPREAIASKLRALRDGTQPGTVMPQLAKGYTDAQIDTVAGYFAAQAPPR